MKKSVVFITSAILSFASASLCTNADDSTAFLEFSITENGAAVVSCADNAGSVVIPSEYMGVPVTSISEFAFYGSNVTSVTIPDTVTTIGESAFFRCCELTSIRLPKNLEAIECGVFCCTPLTSIEIPASVNYIDTGVFDDCLKLCEISVDDSNPFYTDIDGVLFSKDMKQIVAYPAAKTSEEYVVPDGVEEIAEYAFCGAQFKSVLLPDTIHTIGSSAFCEAANLRSISLPKGVSRIEAVTFCGCTSLESVYFNSEVTIDPYAF